MKISVIIPVYNVSDFIIRCLASALNQTYQDIEFILVDDCTPDLSMDLAEKFIAQHPRKDSVKIIHHPSNKGLGAARNSGVKEASGEYIFFLDSDDELPSQCIEILAALAKNSSIDMIIGEIEVIGNKRNAYPPLKLKDGIYHGNQIVLNAFLQKEWYEMAWNKLIKRDFFTEKNIWFTEGILHEDTLWSFQMALEVQSLAVIHARTYYYHIQNNSITQKKSQKNIDSFYFVIEEIINEAKLKNLFYTQLSVYTYLEGLRIYFIKNLINNQLIKEYILNQKKRIDNLFTLIVWKNRKRSFIATIKEKVLEFHLKRKLIH